MAESNKTTVLDFSYNTKNASLFFDYVIPADSQSILNFSHEYGDLSARKCMSCLSKIMPPEIKEDNDLAMAFWSQMLGMHRMSFDLQNLEDWIKKDYPDSIENMHRFKYKKLSNWIYSVLENDGLSHYIESPHLYLSTANDLCDTSYDCISLNLAEIPLIDTTKTKWEQIFTFREDKESVKKLRNLRLFFHENYSGKEKSFVIDDLCQRYEAYWDTVKGWGFDTLTSSMTLLSTSVSAIGTSLVSALTGQPLEIAAAQGLCVGIGSISLNLAKEKKKLLVFQRENPLAYIIDAKKQLE